ncbi:MAG: SET domain-containing protein-lysine N-methyltransferase [Proteobacteria bacterium]|nr:SET domain-containing protein-lysine N-methyltransferase [Pseudomonadota bacterium]
MSINPCELEKNIGYPSRASFVVKKQDNELGAGVYTKKTISRGSLVARFSGTIVEKVVQHSLQINPTSHLHDPHFAGLLLHSCSPNVMLDMQGLTIWAIKDIESGEALTMDYASTEDFLFKQFKCLCQSDNCRHWISGRKEKVNEEGKAYLKSIQEKSLLRIRKTG